jgi:hypothetical protein
MRHLESAGHRGHGTERTLGDTMGTGACSGTHEARVRQLSDGAMTGGSQPTNIRGIDRRGKVPGGPPAPGASFDRRAGPLAGRVEVDLTGQSISVFRIRSHVNVEAVEAPGQRGATMEYAGSIRRRSNKAGRVASSAERNKTSDSGH